MKKPPFQFPAVSIENRCVNYGYNRATGAVALLNADGRKANIVRCRVGRVLGSPVVAYTGDNASAYQDDTTVADGWTISGFPSGACAWLTLRTAVEFVLRGWHSRSVPDETAFAAIVDECVETLNAHAGTEL